MARILKRIWIFFIILLMLPFVFVGGGGKAFAEENNDYIKWTVMVSADGKVNTSLIMSCVLPNEWTVIEKEAFKTELAGLLTMDLAEKRSKITEKYLQEGSEEYNPTENIVFGDNGNAVKGKDLVGYNIEYSSVDVYRFYNNVNATYNKGFFLDKSVQVLDNPFNDAIELSGGIFTTEGDVLKSLYLSASETVGKKDYVLQNYNPNFYNDYVTFNKRVKSNAYSVLVDTDNYYHHVWISEGTNYINDDEMQVSLNIIHKGYWYLLGIAVSTCSPVGCYYCCQNCKTWQS